MIKRLNQWRRWAKHNRNSMIYKVAVLLGIIYAPGWDYYSVSGREWELLAEEIKRHARSNRQTGGD